MKLFNKFFKRKSKSSGKVIEPTQNNDQGEETMQSKNFAAGASSLQDVHKTKPSSDVPFIYCLVGNIVEEHYNKNHQKAFKGTKHFSSGTKVYCFPPQWGDGYEKIKVIGRRRHSHRMITVIIPSKYITNWRVKAVYKPFIIKQMHQNAYLHSTENHRENLFSLAASLNEK